MSPNGCAPALMLALLSAMAAGAALAGPMSLFSDEAFGRTDGAPLSMIRAASAHAPSGQGPSLFAGRSGTGLFAPVQPRQAPETLERRNEERAEVLAAVLPAGSMAAAAARIRDLIGHAESRRFGYDAVNHGARRLPPKAPTAMTVGEIYAWIKETPGQPHAIGRYQFIPATLRRLVAELGVDRNAVFNARLQDRLADRLLAEAGFAQMQSGGLGRHAFMNNLAKIWAGLPNSSGKSHYHGYAGNRATMSWAQFDAEMAKIFPG